MHMGLDANGAHIATGAVSGVSGMQAPRSAGGPHADQQQQQQQLLPHQHSQSPEDQRQQQQLQAQAHNLGQQMASRHDLANHSAESTEGYQDDMEEGPRGRERSRDGQGGDIMEGSETSGSGQIGAETPTTRKRRRSRKGLDKKFECPHPGCGKSYSRAEHLYRHQLNRKTS